MNKVENKNEKENDKCVEKDFEFDFEMCHGSYNEDKQPYYCCIL